MSPPSLPPPRQTFFLEETLIGNSLSEVPDSLGSLCSL